MLLHFYIEIRVLVGSGKQDTSLAGRTEIFHIKSQSITMGPYMPDGPLDAASSTPFGDSFIVTGGTKPNQFDVESTGTFPNKSKKRSICM